MLEKEIKITEFDIAITQEAVQADYTRDFMTMVFSHPSVKGILSWGFWENRHWEPNAAMYTSDWSIKPNGIAYNDLVFNDWWTKDTTLISDANGQVSLNGFLGTYSYTVLFDGVESSGSIHVDIPVADNEINEFTLSIDPLVPAELLISIDGETVLCEGETTNLSVSLPQGFAVKWFNGEIELDETGSSIIVDSAGSYHAEATGKGHTIITPSIEIIVNTIPEVSIDAPGELSFCPGGSTILETNSGIPYTYKWYKDGTFFAGSLPRVEVSETGIYKVETNSLGCASFSPELSVTRLSPEDPACFTGIPENFGQFNVSPNPFSHSFMINLTELNKSTVKVELLDLNGKVVYSSIIVDPGQTEIHPDVNDGYYILKLQTEDRVKCFKLIRQSGR